MGIEPISGCLQGILAALVHASPVTMQNDECRMMNVHDVHHSSFIIHRSKLRERESNPRRRAYETLLAPLQSTPQ